ncbi:hypothetical protein ODJ79_20165 [Actinoplanes sp. KI2]|uniref:alkaline phosphatase family protein n=1 Tax=Actinoplanes sp. KI2 TaxID=2983315 RepID=UPI0021D5E774|nr:alkaline phosphatase family protein [Actinoplanes sp. KI2]MCU7726046.1 hypothetical protein [Actinoplanes sp. KI2]
MPGREQIKHIVVLMMENRSFDHLGRARSRSSGSSRNIAGVRVPAVAISPLIPAGFVDRTFYEHAAIPHTVLRQFVPGSRPLTRRDAASADLLDRLPLLPSPRTDIRPVPVPVPRAAAATGPHRMNDFQSSLVELAGGVHNARTASPAVAARPEMPEFRPEASTLAAARAGVLTPGSEASQVVDAVVADFVD